MAHHKIKDNYHELDKIDRKLRKGKKNNFEQKERRQKHPTRAHDLMDYYENIYEDYQSE